MEKGQFPPVPLPAPPFLENLMVKKAGALVWVHLRPHDLRRHAATYASRSVVPVDIVSKIILRHANLSTTQRYLGKVSDVEAVRWIENLYG
jgi:integrase